MFLHDGERQDAAPPAGEPAVPGMTPSGRFEARWLLWAAGGAATLVASGAVFDFAHALYAYLAAFMFCLTLVLGMMFWVMLHHVTDAAWSTVVRRPAEQCLAALPWLAALLVPILAFAWKIYPWVGADLAKDKILREKAAYLNVPFFLVRAAVFFGAWLLLARIFRGRSLRQDETGDPRLSLSMRRWSAPAFFVYALTFTFAGIDWVMTLDPHWFSTVFGVYLFAGAAVASMALLTLMAVVLSRPGGRLEGKVSDDTLHDMGKLLFAFSVFWAYIAFSQYFLIWYANLPEETVWFMHRWHGGWKVMSVLLPVGQFVVPFVVLMSGVVKRKPAVMIGASLVILASHYLDLYWLIFPHAHTHHPLAAGVWIDAAALVMVGSLVAWVIVRAIAQHPAYPIHDPRLAEALAAGHHPAAHETPAAPAAAEVTGV